MVNNHLYLITRYNPFLTFKFDDEQHLFGRSASGTEISPLLRAINSERPFPTPKGNIKWELAIH